jgi:hypothetical protein
MDTELTRAERARITDTTHNLQSADDILSNISPAKIPGYEGIRSCLQNADKTLRGVLRGFRPPVRKR